ncbi:probable LRR receptor-like serine/threonine-protein kinase At1g53430 isoform X3 [Citrus sinensis]|uniref:probable LRR receptor-like serine/threonine-protein kinase At1g53430 isoform X3 n=1 Tax=Citrus sinensis TaxID=2711 RepID=UPI0022798C33|nr:probable LRR receptor-like serine/threonine-protein kinase At1g53430 isoform X3 [Citrus sinensis]
MDERSAGHRVVLISKTVFLLILFLLCQLGSEFKFQSTAENDTKVGDLPAHEVAGLPDMLSSLQWRLQLPKLSSYCREKPDLSLNIIITYPVDKGTPHISEITMDSLALTGIISEHVAALTHLQKLDLSVNTIHGSIPDQIGQLDQLITLDLSYNQLTGTIPTSLGNLRNLEVLNLGQNLLTGKIPPSLGRLSSLKTLSLLENGLNGTLPPELGKLSNLQKLRLQSNNLRGDLPKDYENLKNLTIFGIAGNYLSGRIPTFIAKWVNLYALNLMGNNFEGELPPEIFNMSSLQSFYVSDLQTMGFSFPKSANLSSISSLILRNCSITGSIPPYIADWSQLGYLDLSFNNLTGGIPNTFKKLFLYELYLTGNMLNGTLPDWIYSNVTKKGDLAYNEFIFPEPEAHKNLPNNNSRINLEPKNRTFPAEIVRKYCPDGQKKSQYNYNLHINTGGDEHNIEGIRYEADNSTSNFYVNKPAYNWAYSCNGYFFSDSTADSREFIQKVTCGAAVTDAPLYDEARLCPNSLKYYGFCLRDGNYTVSLYFSEIVFTNNDDYSSSGKRVFDIYIQRELRLKDFNIKEMARHSNNVTIQSFEASVREHLLEIELFWAGKGSLYDPPYFHGPLISAISVTPNFEVNRPGGLSKKVIVGIVLGAVLALILFMALVWRLGWIGDRELRVTTVNLRGKSYTVKQVKVATRNFSPRNVIGTGRFGTVYKALTKLRILNQINTLYAELPDQTVAVKMLSSQSKHVIDQIGTEVYALTTLKHENIVEFLDGYSKKDLNLLIYEYMEKGSLERALFDANSSTRLDWPARVSICHGIAKGLKYLHEDNPSRKIVHRNIKPSNILLDGNLNAKVSDLGLAKLYDEENPYKFIQEKGTVVYMAPEYAMRKAIIEKVDVFSFGIVLLEIISGQTNAKYEANQETEFLLDTAIVLHSKGRLSELVDKQMPNEHVVMKQAKIILELAMRCVDQSPTLRPTMSEVLSELERISN